MEDINKLSIFIRNAKQNTYSSDGESEEIILDDCSKELNYKEGNLNYRDRYFGFNPFSGEEIVWKNDKAIWSMNYYGLITASIIPVKEVYGFLKKTLQKVNKDNPFRGPEYFKEGDIEYSNKTEGNIKKFIGVETISYKGKKIYHLHYHGGTIITS